MEQFESKYFRGQGAVFIGGRDLVGQPTGLTFIGDASELSLTPNIERSEKIENVTGSSGVAVSTLKSIKYSLSLTMASIKPEHLAIALDGTLQTVAGAPVLDEPHICYMGKFTPLKKSKVSAVTVTGAGGTPTYALDTDYIVHADKGMVEFIPGGTITDATPVLIDYTFATQSIVTSSPGNNERYILFAGLNTNDNNKQSRSEMYKVKLDPAALNAITEDTTDMTISGTVEIDSIRPAGDQFFSWLFES